VRSENIGVLLTAGENYGSSHPDGPHCLRSNPWGDSFSSPGGATISGFGSTDISIISPTELEYFTAWNSSIQVPILAQGAVNFGNVANTSINSSGTIVLTNGSNQFNTVNVNNMTLLAVSPAVLSGANIALNGGVLALISNITNSGLPPTLYSNPINVTQNSVIADNTRSINPVSVLPPPSANHPIALSNVSLGNAQLGLDHFVGGIAIGSLTLTGNGTLSELQSDSQAVISLNAIGQDGSTPRSLTFGGPNLQYSFLVNGNITSTGAISINTTGVEIDGAISSSTAPLSVSNGGLLAGNAIILRPIVFSGTSGSNGGTLSPGARSGTTFFARTTPGTMTIDSLILAPGTTLEWDLGAPGGAGNDFVVVNGDLTLDGRLSIIRGTNFGPGTYTLMT
jgi:hypothetical protein